jgi:hypothetical protein
MVVSVANLVLTLIVSEELTNRVGLIRTALFRTLSSSCGIRVFQTPIVKVLKAVSLPRWESMYVQAFRHNFFPMLFHVESFDD